MHFAFLPQNLYLVPSLKNITAAPGIIPKLNPILTVLSDWIISQYGLPQDFFMKIYFVAKKKEVIFEVHSKTTSHNLSIMDENLLMLLRLPLLLLF